MTRAGGVLEAFRVILGERGEAEGVEKREEANGPPHEVMLGDGDVPVPGVSAAFLPSDESPTSSFLSPRMSKTRFEAGRLGIMVALGPENGLGPDIASVSGWERTTPAAASPSFEAEDGSIVSSSISPAGRRSPLH